MDTHICTLAESIGSLLLRRGSSVSTAESCTGGWIAQALTAIPGSSGWFHLGLVTYANSAKHAFLQVPLSYLEGDQAPGAVSRETVEQMARGALEAADSDFAIASSGIAGPGGGSVSKPVGTVWLAWAWRRDGGTAAVAAREFLFSGDRESIRRQSVIAALEGLEGLLRDGRIKNI
ncbi:CinA family protein [Pseudohongiella spirulinae]|uniref:CinA family protein n=1 Tax=Pseudohongiella spirulinae TaxID=1249552 RepID=UPI000717A37B|nr:CinA family protein [Pseudohongiella spirulinae]